MTVESVKRMIVECMVHVGYDGCGAGELYCLCGMDMRVWDVVRTMMVESDIAKVSPGHFVTLTTAGKKMLTESLEATR